MVSMRINSKYVVVNGILGGKRVSRLFSLKLYGENYKNIAHCFFKKITSQNV